MSRTFNKIDLRLRLKVMKCIEPLLTQRQDGCVEYAGGKTDTQIAAELTEKLGATITAHNVMSIRKGIMPGRLVTFTAARSDVLAAARAARIARIARIAKLEAENADLRRALETITSALRPKAAE